MKITQKNISKGLLGFFSVQVLFVGVGLSRSYLSPQKEQIDRATQQIVCHQDEILYGAISNNPIQYLAEPIQGGTREFKAYLIGTTTGTNGDSAVIAIPA